MKVVVIGGVVGGFLFVICFCWLNEVYEIIIYECGVNIFYVSCVLFYYLGGVIIDCDLLIECILEILKIKNNIDVFIKYEVIVIDFFIKWLIVKDLFINEEIKIDYDKLIISFGVRLDYLDIFGVFEVENGFVFCSVMDVDWIKLFFEEKKL